MIRLGVGGSAEARLQPREQGGEGAQAPVPNGLDSDPSPTKS